MTYATVHDVMENLDARTLYQRSVVWDMVWPLGDWYGNDWGKLDRFHAAGYDVLSVTLAGDNHNVSQALELVAAARQHVLARPERLRLVSRVDDVIAAKRDGLLAVAFHFEGTRCFERNLDMIEVFYALGVRHTLLAFNQTNSCGCGCAEANDGGLSRFGRSLIAQMNRVGMLLDLSHVGRRTSLEAIDACAGPVVFSHSNSAALHSHFRNLTDAQIRACAARDGLIGISGSSEYLGDARASTESLFRHLDYVAQLVGADHVGLGLDIVFEPEPLTAWIRKRPDEWPGTEDPAWPGLNYARPEQVFELTSMMVDAGYAPADIEAILGGNYLRICSEVWR